jgi:hypothetical protein
MVWVNIDKPTKKCTIHSNMRCQYVLRRSETPLKGIGEIKRDGGWLPFETMIEAENYCSGNHTRYNISVCCE